MKSILIHIQGIKSPQSPVIAAILLMVAAVFAMSLMDVTAKWLVTDHINALQLVAIRGWITIPLFLLILLARGECGKTIGTPRWPLHILRSTIGLGAPLLFFYSLSKLPLADATALFFSATFIMTALSALVLKERVGVHRWSSIVVGFVGVLIVTQPGTDALRIEALYVLLSSLAYALFITGGRWLSSSDSPFTLVFYFQFTGSLICTPFLIGWWQPMSADVIVAVVLFSAFAVIGHFALSHALSLAPVSAIAPYEYLAIVWAILFGYWFWGDVPGPTTISGTVIIVASGLYIAHREKILSR